MKYMAEDGTVFPTEQACLDHENLEGRRDVVRARVDRYLSLLDKTDRAKAIARGHIMGFLEHDMRQHPEPWDVPVPPVRAVEG